MFMLQTFWHKAYKLLAYVTQWHRNNNKSKSHTPMTVTMTMMMMMFIVSNDKTVDGQRGFFADPIPLVCTLEKWQREKSGDAKLCTRAWYATSMALSNWTFRNAQKLFFYSLLSSFWSRPEFYALYKWWRTVIGTPNVGSRSYQNEWIWRVISFILWVKWSKARHRRQCAISVHVLHIICEYVWMCVYVRLPKIFGIFSKLIETLMSHYFNRSSILCVMSQFVGCARVQSSTMKWNEVLYVCITGIVFIRCVTFSIN